MKPGPLDRDYLSRGLRGYPGAAEHVANLDSIERMPWHALLSLAKKLDVDAPAMIKAAQERDDERMRYSHQFPAFEGVLNFEITFEVLGRRITRKAKASYTYTPEWEYFDRRKKAPYVGWAGSSLSVSVRTIPKKDGEFDGSGWEELGILDVGEIWDVLDAEIEERCKAEDAKRRRTASRLK